MPRHRSASWCMTGCVAALVAAVALRHAPQAAFAKEASHNSTGAPAAAGSTGNTTGGGDNGTSASCQPTCLFKTCSEWVSDNINTCSGLEDLGCDCRGCDGCEDADAVADGPWTVQDNVKCGVTGVANGPVAIGDNGGTFDIMEVALCLDVCERAPECGGVWYDKAKVQCIYVANTSVAQSSDPWSACYTVHRDRVTAAAGAATTTPASAAATHTPAAATTTATTTKSSDRGGGAHAKTTTTNSKGAPSKQAGKPGSGDGDGATTCAAGCITDDRTCEDWKDYYTCAELEEKIPCDCAGCACAVDCVGAWTAWSACDVSCGTGQATRSFKLFAAAASGGAECAFEDGTVQEAACVVRGATGGSASGDSAGQQGLNCPVNCVGEWSDWGACSATCGDGGTMQRTFAVETQPLYGGLACPISQTSGCSAATSCVCPDTCMEEGFNCEDWIGQGDGQCVATGPWTCSNLEVAGVGCDCGGCDCSVDCVGAWTAWSACDVTCGSGRALRSFEVTVAAREGGEACVAMHGAVQDSVCAALDPDADDGDSGGGAVLNCPVDCVGEWSAWGACSVTCGSDGTKQRIFAVENQPKYGGAACPISQTNGCGAAASCACPKTCLAGGFSCDDWIATSDEWTCSALEADTYGCDCSACACDGSAFGGDASLDCDNPTCAWWQCTCP